MRLIDADALIDTIAIIAKKFAKSDAQKALMGRVIYHLEHKPECIVRCGNCKHWASHRAAKYGRCMCVEEIAEGQWHTQADDFCSHGERKEE